MSQKRRESIRKKCSLFVLHAHARSHPEGGGDGGKYGDYDVQDFSPDVLVFHLWFLINDFFFLHHRGHRVPRSFFLYYSLHFVIHPILSSIPFCHSDDRRANEAFRGKTRCLSVLSEGSSVLRTTEHEESRVHPLVFSLLYVPEILRYTPFRSGWH